MDNLHIKEKINNAVKKEVWSTRLFSDLSEAYEIIVFGGAVRDVLYKYNRELRDVDIVLNPIKAYAKGKRDDLWEKVIQRNCSGRYTRNQFGGYKIRGSGITIDIWLLKDTWAFKQKLMPPERPNLLKSVYLNIDAYAWSYNLEAFISQCDTVQHNKIDIVLEESLCEYLNLIRAVVYGQKYNMGLSRKITDKLRKMLEDWAEIETDIYAIEARHFGSRVVTRQDICNAIERTEV